MKNKTCLTCGKEFTVVVDHPSVSFCSFECATEHAESFHKKYDIKQMTPQEIFDYKLKWKPGTQIPVHSDYESRCKDWCKEHLKQWQWSQERYTDIYEHTFQFELEEFANLFLEFYNDIRK